LTIECAEAIEPHNLSSMSAFLRDLRYSARLLAKNPTFTIAVVLSLAIGIGANAAIFSLINGVLLKPLPFKNSERLVTLWQQPFKHRVLFASLSGPNYKDCKEQSRVFDSLGAFSTEKEATLTGEKGAERVGTRRVSGDFFSTCQLAPALGRWFSNEELDADERHVAIISDALWKRQFAGRLDVIGMEITLDREVYNIVGVSPSIFEAMGYRTVDVLLPLRLNSNEMTRRDMYLLDVIGRLKPGVTVSEAQAEMDVIAARLAQNYPDPNFAPEIKVMTPRGLTVWWYRSLLVMLQAAILLVLLIACTNVASLLLARWTGRQQELAIRAALGANRWSMLRLSLSESILLVLSGTLAGIWLADGFRRAIISVAPADIPRLSEVQIDMRVLFGIMALSTCLTLFFALVPLLFSRGIEIRDSLSQGGRATTAGIGRQRLRSFLVASQVMLTVVLLSGAALFIRSLWRLQKTDLGFQPENLLTFHLFPDSVRYRTSEEIAGFYTMVLDRINSVPGVGETCAASHPPFNGGAMGNPVGQPGRMRDRAEQMTAQTLIVTSEYFRTLGIKLIAGRPFTENDTQGAPPVVIINENLARHLFPSENSIGKQIQIDAAQFPDPDNVQPRTAQIVGVVGDSKQWEMTEPLHNVIHVPFAQNPAPSMFVVAKTRIHSAGLVDSVRKVVSELDPDQPVYDVQMMTERIRGSQAERNFNATLLVLFAAVALVATAIGIYGTLAFWVAQRTHEIGVRMALGARTRHVLSLVVGKIGWLMFVGIALGLPAAVAAVRLVRSFVYQGQPAADMFYGVSSMDPLTMLAVFTVLLGSAAVAAVIPAWRATSVDPAKALQAE
jgi:putative ABC transport system permease protein